MPRPSGIQGASDGRRAAIVISLRPIALRALCLTLVLISACNGVFLTFATHAAPIASHSPAFQLHQSDQPQRASPSLDIARVVPYPADFPELAPNLGFLDGRFVSTEDQAVRSLDGSMDDAALSSAKRQLLRAGWLRRYEGRLAAPLAGDPDQFGVQLSSFVVEYASPRDAANAFAALAKQNEGAANPLVGDESLLLEFAGTTPDTNTEYRAVKLVYRVGPLLCSMTFADLTGDPPSVEMVVAAGGLVAERARIVVAEGTVPLGSMLLQFTERGDSRNDVYATRAGVQTSLLSENTLEPFALPQAAGDAFVSRLASVIANPHLAQAAATDAQGVIEMEGQGSGTLQPANLPSAALSPEISLFTILFSFNADSEASAWLNAASAEAANIHDGSLALIDSPSLGDESFSFRLGRDTDPVEQPNGFVLLARLGSIGIVQELRSSTGVSLEGAANVMRQQLACIAQFGCSGIADVPQSIFGGRDAPLSVNLTAEAPQERVGTEAQAVDIE
jgi:hypothetical protein